MASLSRKYRITVSVLFGLAGFFVNFLDLELIQTETYKISILLGLLFPLLIALAWGWRWGLLSALAGGCQTMWWLWRGDGWAFLYAVPVFTLWVVWHGWGADRRRAVHAAAPRKASPLHGPLQLSPFLLEIPFRLVISLGFFTLFPLLAAQNPPPWNPDITWTAVSAKWIWTVVIKHTITAYILLTAAQFLLQLNPMIRLFRLPHPRGQDTTSAVYTGTILAIAGLWIIDALVDSLFFHPAPFLDNLILKVPPHEFYIRTLLILSFLLFGMILDRAVRKTAVYSSRMGHLNRVLAAIRNVNQLITKETDRTRLMDQACQLLIETRGYRSAWICLLQEDRPAEPYFHAGFGTSFQAMTDMLDRGELPPCARSALSQGRLQVITVPREECPRCPLAGLYAPYSGLTVPLIRQDRTYGWLSVATPRETAADTEEQDLLKEVAGDITFALASMEDREAQEAIQEKQNATREQLSRELREKETLLKEVHHRVKNNLQIIISLLHMQSAASADPRIDACLQEALNRIRTISDVHEQLYHSDSLARIAGGTYLSRLIRQQIPQPPPGQDSPWILDLPREDPPLSMEEAIPLGLITNEFLTNTLKHAFPDGTPSPEESLRISLQLSAVPSGTNPRENTLTLTYRDNGRGLPEDFDPQAGDSLGFKLILSLTEQIGGQLEVLPPTEDGWKTGFRITLSQTNTTGESTNANL